MNTLTFFFFWSPLSIRKNKSQHMVWHSRWALSPNMCPKPLVSLISLFSIPTTVWLHQNIKYKFLRLECCWAYNRSTQIIPARWGVGQAWLPYEDRTSFSIHFAVTPPKLHQMNYPLSDSSSTPASCSFLLQPFVMATAQTLCFVVDSTKILEILHMQVNNVRAFEPKLKSLKATAHIEY